MIKCGSIRGTETEDGFCLRAICNRPATWQLISIEKDGYFRNRESAGVYECDEHKEDLELRSLSMKSLNLVWRQL